MKITLSLILILVSIQAHAIALFRCPGPGIIQNVTKTVPFVINPISVPFEAAFWGLLLAQSAVDMLDRGMEPLENYEVGVWTMNRLDRVIITYPKLNYSNHDILTMTSFHHNYFDGTDWWVKRISFTNLLPDGTSTTTITWSVTPPAIPDFNRISFHISRPAGPVLESSFSEERSESCLFYCKRNGKAAWARPVRCTVYYWTWKPDLQTGDYVRKMLIAQGENTQWILIGPNSVSTWVPAIPYTDSQIEYNRVGVATAFYSFPCQ